MNVVKTDLPGVVIVEPQMFPDDRGYFLETWNQERYRQAGISGPFVQDNFSRSSRGTLRGLHLQCPTTQGKLVTAISGRIFDVVVDVRRGSPTFGQWVSVVLDDQARRQIWAPRGFAHGFCVLSETADVLYKVDAPYRPNEEISIAYDDPQIGVIWPLTPEAMSQKDRTARALADIADLPEFAGDAL